MGGGGDVKEHHLIGALLVVAQRQFDRIAHIAQPASLGDAEPHAASDLAAMHVQAGNDTFSDHRGRLNRFAAPESISSVSFKQTTSPHRRYAARLSSFTDTRRKVL